MSLWQIVALAVVGLVLLIGAIVLLMRARARAPEAPDPPSLAAVWDRFTSGLPASARRDPVVVVLGDRLAGKSSIVEAALAIAAGPAIAAPPGPADARLTCYAGRQTLVQEISFELLEDTRPEARAALHQLWRPIGLDVPLLICVLDARAASWTPAGLKRFGALMRDKIDLLTAVRGGPPRVRVSVTHLDECAEGFNESATVARDAGNTAALAPAGYGAEELKASLSVLDRYLTPAISTLDPAGLGRLTRFSTTTGPRVVSALAPFLESLLGGRAGATAPSLDGIVLAGLPQGGAGVMIGDPLALDTKELKDAIERDARTLDRRRATTAILVGTAAVALLLGLYGWHYYAVDRADQAVRRFAAAVTRAKREPQKSWSSDGGARAAESEAADALDSALAPSFPPLRLAFPKKKRGLAEGFLQQVRELYVLPQTQDPGRTRRIYALSLLYAANENALGQQVHAAPESWAVELDVPARVIDDYLTWSERSWTGTVRPPAASGGEVTLDDWRDWLRRLDEALRREKIAPDQLDDLQKKGRVLGDSVGGALEVRGLESTIKLLREARGAEIDAFLGPNEALQRAPGWVSENWEALDALLAMVRESSLAVPAAQGKSLRRALDDFAVIGRASAGEVVTTYQLALSGEAYSYRTDAWTALIRSSRAALYTRGFIDDVRTTSRSVYFIRPADYAPAGAGGTRSRGPYKSIPGIYTARAVAAEVKPALVAFDPTLDAAHLPGAERAELTALIQDETARYASSYRNALWEYITSFRLDVTSPAGLRADLEDMVGPASWFTTFWVAASENAALDPEGNTYLQPLVEALGPFQPVVQVMTGDKGKYPMLDKYYAVIASVVPSIDAGAPAPPGPPGAALEERLPPLGKLGVAILDTDKPAPLPQVNAWLDGARLLDKSLRQPFTVGIELVYTYALQTVEKTLDQAYREQIRPLVAPQLSRFPLDPRATNDASPDELVAVVGPKGSFRSNLDLLIGPVCKKANDGSCVPKAPAGFRAVRLPGDAAELSAWSASLAGVLWDDAGKPKSIALTARPRSLQEVRKGDATVATLSFLRAGSTTVYGFNQTPTWQALPIAWSTSAAAASGVERTDPATNEKVVLTTEGEGAAWRFYRLLCKGQVMGGGAVTWAFDPPVTFDITPDPWALIVPPANRGRRCAQIVARN